MGLIRFWGDTVCFLEHRTPPYITNNGSQPHLIHGSMKWQLVPWGPFYQMHIHANENVIFTSAMKYNTIM
jgi:hypothetical protein